MYALDGRDKRVSTPLAKELEKKIDASFTAIIKRYDILQADGLIEEEYSGASTILSITDKGKKVAEKLKEIDRIMEE